MGRLRNIQVDWVSLVDRPANRDPEDPLEPSHFLLRKSESRDDLKAAIRDEIEAMSTDDTAPATTPPRKDPIHMATETPTPTDTPAEPSDVREAAAACILALNPYASQIDPDLLTALVELSQEGLDNAGEGEDAAAKAEATVTKLAKVEKRVLKVAKSEDREGLRQAVARARKQVEEEYLAAIRV